MSIGQDFPVVGPGGEVEWWVVNRPSSPGGGRGVPFTHYVVVSTHGNNPPLGKVAGPFTTQALAQNWVTGANTAGNSPGSALGGAIDATGLNPIPGLTDIAHRLTEQSTWIRVGEFVAGMILLYVGGKAFFPQTVNNITQTGKAIGKAAAIGAI